MDNANVIIDDEGSDEGDPPETMRLRPYYNWNNDPLSMAAAGTDFPRVDSQVPLSPKIAIGDEAFGYELAVEHDEETEDEDNNQAEEFKRKRSFHKRVVRPPVKGKKVKDRGTWQGRFDFILSLVGYSVGLGNVWRFPYLVYSNGGGAFLIPFLIMMVIVGFPLMFMELAFGQYASLSPVCIFSRFSPLFAGLGYGMIAVSGIVMLYYNMILAWTFFYTFVSITTELPWSRCDLNWSTSQCYSYKEADECMKSEGNITSANIYYNRTCMSAATAAALNVTPEIAHAAVKKGPAAEYFNNFVLGNMDTIEQTGNIQWHLNGALLFAWLIVFLCLSKGVQSSGKVVYFTALFPYVVLVILFVRGITLPGAMDGIAFYLKPDFSRLISAQVWGDAAVQVFFALSPAWGGLITLASYNKFENNCYRDSILVLFANAGTSIFSGFVVFSIIGYLANELELPVDAVVEQGVGLAFMVYPEVVARLPISPLWSFLFFVMLITLGLDSQFALLETVQTAVLDRFPSLRDHKILILLLVSTIGYAGGIIFTTQSGVLWLGLFDHYAANFSVSIIAITECLLIAWYYGADRFIRDIEKMIGPQTSCWRKTWTLMWKYVTPATIFFILGFNWIKHEPMKYGDYVYPEWANVFGWVLAFIPSSIIIITMLQTYITYDGGNMTCLQKINALMQPSESWGPTHKNIERLQRRSSRFAARNSSTRSANSSQPSSSRMSAGEVNFREAAAAEAIKNSKNPNEPLTAKQTVVKILSPDELLSNGRLPTLPPTPPPFVSLLVNGNHKTKVTPSVSAPPTFPSMAAATNALKKDRKENTSMKNSTAPDNLRLAPTTTTGSSSSEGNLISRGVLLTHPLVSIDPIIIEGVQSFDNPSFDVTFSDERDEEVENQETRI